MRGRPRRPENDAVSHRQFRLDAQLSGLQDEAIVEASDRAATHRRHDFRSRSVPFPCWQRRGTWAIRSRRSHVTATIDGLVVIPSPLRAFVVKPKCVKEGRRLADPGYHAPSTLCSPCPECSVAAQAAWLVDRNGQRCTKTHEAVPPVGSVWTTDDVASLCQLVKGPVGSVDGAAAALALKYVEPNLVNVDF